MFALAGCTDEETAAQEGVSEVNMVAEVDAGLIPLFEDFSGEADFWSAGYRSLPGDNTKPLYYNLKDSTFDSASNTVTVSNGRFTIGMDRFDSDGNVINTEQNDTNPGGVLDLSKPYKVTIEYTRASENTENRKFQVYVDNNTTSAGNSIHWSESSTTKSRIYNSNIMELPAINPATGIGTIAFESSVGTDSSFLSIRVENNASITIKSIRIEYQ